MQTLTLVEYNEKHTQKKGPQPLATLAPYIRRRSLQGFGARFRSRMGDSISEVSNLACPAMEAIPLTVVGDLRCSDPARHVAAHHAAVQPPPSRSPQAPLSRS